MGEKRRLQSGDDQYGGSAKRYKGGKNNGNGYENEGRPWQAKKQQDSSFGQETASSAAAKKRVRAIERALQRGAGTMPNRVRDELERELDSLKNWIEGRQQKKERSRMIKKYHMIRFFERKKAVRLEKQLKRRLAETDDPAERARLEADLHIAEIDQLYAAFFPFMEPYVSLYPKAEQGEEDKKTKEKETKKKAGKKDKKKSKEQQQQEDDEEQERMASSAAQALHAPRPPLWTVVETTLLEGGISALERLRDRRPPRKEETSSKTEGDEETADKAPGKRTKSKGDKFASKRASNRAAQEEDDDDDGDNFLEDGE